MTYKEIEALFGLQIKKKKKEKSKKRNKSSLNSKSFYQAFKRHEKEEEFPIKEPHHQQDCD